jgi:hypothetical protein
MRFQALAKITLDVPTRGCGIPDVMTVKEYFHRGHGRIHRHLDCVNVGHQPQEERHKGHHQELPEFLDGIHQLLV